MNKWMKWTRGDEPITGQDVVATAAIGMLLGGAIVWFVFAAFWGYQIFEDSGSAADWAAALATGLVGWGAWKYAKEAHFQRLTEERERRTSERKTRERRFDAIALRLHRVTRLQNVMENGVAGKTVENLSDEQVFRITQLFKRVSPILRWPVEEAILLSHRSQTKLAAIETKLIEGRQGIVTYRAKNHLSD